MGGKDGRREMEKLFNFRPVFFCAVLLSLGIVFGFQYYFNGASAFWFLSLIPLSVCPFFFCRTREKVFSTAFAVGMLGIFFFLGFFCFSMQAWRYFDRAGYLGGNYIVGKVAEKRPYSDQIGFILEDLSIGGKRVDGKLIAYLPASFEDKITLSDEVLLTGDVREVAVSGENFSFMAGEFGDGVRFRVWAEEAAVTGQSFDLFLFLRTRAERVIEAGMDKTPAAVTRAVLFGYTSGIDEGLYENIRQGGIAHIFAVSGLHVGALFAFCLLILTKTPLRRLPKAGRFLLLGILLFVYAGICGFSSSVIRATVICLAAYASTLLRIKTDFIESLGLSAIIILLLTPSALFEVGFQLSFSACFGIAFLTKPIGQVFDELVKPLKKLIPNKRLEAEKEAMKNDDTLPPTLTERAYRAGRDFLSVSLGAQIFTAPFLLQYFGYASGWALLLNCIFVPLISAVFSMLLLLVFAACLLPNAAAATFLYLPNLVWSAILLVFQTLDFSSFAISGLQFSVGAFFAYFACWLFCSDKWNLKRTLSRVLAGVCFLAFMITMAVLNL